MDDLTRIISSKVGLKLFYKIFVDTESMHKAIIYSINPYREKYLKEFKEIMTRADKEKIRECINNNKHPLSDYIEEHEGLHKYIEIYKEIEEKLQNHLGQFHYLNEEIKWEGLEYCFLDCSNWSPIEDDEFHKIRLKYVKYAYMLKDYIKERSRLYEQ